MDKRLHPPTRPLAIYWILLAAILYAVMALSYLCFWLKPSAFYFRSWEYFADVVNRTKSVPPLWEGYERGDMSRKNFFFYQKQHATKVSADQDGYRSTPTMPGPYRIVFLGDSTIFGSGLSDEDTLPWRLAERLGAGVFNAARQSVNHVLGRKDLAHAKLVIEGQTERAMVENLRDGPLNPQGYLPLRQDKLGLLDCAPLQLFFLPSIADRSLGRMGNDLQDIISRQTNKPLELERYRHVYTPGDLAIAVKAAKQRQEALSKLGLTYVLLPVPAYQTIYAANVDSFTKDFIPRLCRELANNNIPCVDLTAVMRRHNNEELWQYVDTHWNGRATELAAEELAVFLRGHGLLPEGIAAK